MKLSSKIQKCGLSPMRKFYPCEVAAEARGLRVHHLNIGQPDIETLGYPLTCDEILATYGGSEALQIVLSCILDEGDEILIPEPYYPNYDTFVRSTGGVIRPIPTTVEEGYRYADRAKIEPLINAHTRAILITNPGNPTGVVLSAAERRLMVDIAREHDLFLISDEVYREIVYGAEAPSSMLEFADAAENVAVVDSVSKRFSATGARVGALLSRNRELMDEAMKMNQMVKNLLTLNQLEFGDEDISFERFDLAALIRGVLQSMEILAQQDELKIIFRQESPVYVWADEFKTEQVVRNYVSNAFHHASGDKVIEVKIQKEGKKARTSVFNTGTPIPEEDLKHIWEKFYKVDKAHTREYGGNGIGLSIVKAIMESFHQEYGVKNYDNGVEFWFELDVE